MAIKITKKDVLWSYAGYFFNLGTNLIIIPFTLRLISGAELGLWYTFLSVGSLVTLLDFGFSQTLVRNITYAWCGVEAIKAQGYSELKISNEGPNYKLFVTVLKSCKYISMFVATAALFVLFIAGTRYIKYVARDIPGNSYIYAWYIFNAAVFFNIYYNYWTSTLKGVGAIQQSQKAVIISKITQMVLSILGLYLGFGVIALAGAYLISGFVLRISSKFMLYRYKGIGETIGDYKKSVTHKEVFEIVKVVWYNAKKVGLVSLSTFAITQSTTMISAAFVGLEATASYGLALQIITVIAGVSQTFFTSVTPMMTDFRIGTKREELYKVFSSAMTIYWVLYFVGMVALITVGLPLVRLIKSNTDLPLIMVSFIGLYMFLETNHSLYATFIAISNNIPYVGASLVSGAAIIVFSLGVAKYTTLGIYGLMIVQCLVQLCYNNWKWPYVVMRELKTNPWKMFKIGYEESYKRIKMILMK